MLLRAHVGVVGAHLAGHGVRWDVCAKVFSANVCAKLFSAS